MRIILGSDEKTHLTDAVEAWLRKNGHEVTLAGHLINKEEKWKWVDVGKFVGREVKEGREDFGIVCCFSGTGVSMAANRVGEVRAALCWDAETARLARKWNDANILCLSNRFVSEEVVKEILTAWFETEFDEEDLNEVCKLDLSR